MSVIWIFTCSFYICLYPILKWCSCCLGTATFTFTLYCRTAECAEIGSYWNTSNSISQNHLLSCSCFLSLCLCVYILSMWLIGFLFLLTKTIKRIPVVLWIRGCSVAGTCCDEDVGRRCHGLLRGWMWRLGTQGKSSSSASPQLLWGHGNLVHSAQFLLRLLRLMTISFLSAVCFFLLFLLKPCWVFCVCQCCFMFFVL